MASDSDEEFNDESLWETELEIALLTKCDYGTIRNITKLRAIPDNLRSKVWKICLNVQQEIEANAISKWKEVFDLPQQDKIREDCKALAEKIHPEDKEQQFVTTSQLESIITYYCKTNDEFYEKENGWIEILTPIMKLKLNKNETYCFFNAILKRYIPNDCVRNGSPYHLFRLLMLYHDPELCAYLDTKKISPDSYAHSWFRSLFATVTRPEVTLPLWDIYFQLGDQFLVFFMSLILLYNMREEILTNTGDKEKSELTKIIQESPASMDAEDLPDFNSLCQSFGTRTPQSFRKIFQDMIIKEYKKPLFEGVTLEKKASGIYQALCLPVSVDELLQANQLGSGGVRYFIIDCRPADKYNASHYATAFHLDANLMLENQAEFNQSVEALLAAQKQAIDSGSVAGGQHLCFMGSGAASENNNQDEDKYVNMVVANFLQRKINYVSLALGGYEKLKQSVEDPEMIVGTELVSPQQARSKFTEEWVQKLNIKPAGDSLFNKFSSAFKMKSFDLNIKDKVKDYLSANLTAAASATTTPTAPNQTVNAGMKKSASAPKHVSSSDKIGKLYRNQGNLFAIDDDANDDDDESAASDRQNSLIGSLDSGSAESELVSLKTWLDKPEVVNKFKCYHRERKSDPGPGEKSTEWVPGYLLLTKTHLYGLTQPVSNSKATKNGMVKIAVRHPLSSVIKIATKSSCPEILSFTYGEKKKTSSSDKNQNDEAIAAAGDADATTAEEEYEVQGKDWFFIPDYAGEAASAVKSKIIEIVDLMAS